jgi:hypothetical protein
MVARKTSRAIYGKPPSSCFPLPPIDPSLDMDIDDFDEPADNLSYNGSMRGPSTAPSTGGPPSSTLRRKTPILSGQGASRLSSQSNEELPDRTQAQGVRNHLPPVPQTYTYSKSHHSSCPHRYFVVLIVLQREEISHCQQIMQT